MFKLTALFLTLAFCLAAATAQAAAPTKAEETYGAGEKLFSLATGSPGELGLLRALAEPFCAKNNAKMAWFKAGSGESLELLKNKTVDMIMVHAPAAEKKAIEDGWATKRVLLGSNEFYIVGPQADPAKIAAASSAADAYKRISAAKALFFSRGDNSGTHKKELAIWKNAGIEPAGEWYAVTKAFMIATLKRANDEKGYFMTDSSTWVAEAKNFPNLSILFRGDKFLINTYHTLVQPTGVTPGAALADQFVDFVASEEGQNIIRGFGVKDHGASLYNDAAYAKKYDD